METAGKEPTTSRIDRKYGEQERRRPAVSRRKHRPRGVLRQSLKQEARRH